MTVISIRRDQLIAALCTAAEKDIRYYLNGIFVEATMYETRLTATDDTVLSTQRFDAAGRNKTADALVGLIIPLDICKLVKPSKKPNETHIEIEQVDRNNWFLTDGAARYEFQPYDGKFPDYRRIIPSGDLKTTPAFFDPLQIAKFAKAAKTLGCTLEGSPIVRITPNGVGCAVVSFGRDAEYVGIIAPLRNTNFAKNTAAWSRDTLPTAK